MDTQKPMWKLPIKQRHNNERRQESLHLLPEYQSGDLKLAHVLSEDMTQTNFSNTQQTQSCTPTVESRIWREGLRFLSPLIRSFQGKSSKTHNYTRAIRGQDYVFEPIEQGLTGHMTGYGKGVKVGDYLILQEGSDRCRYKVEEIDYYSNPEDMWIALLKQVTFPQS